MSPQQLARITERHSIQRSSLPLDTGIKVNLYRGYELRAVLNAFAELRATGIDSAPECFMVADSYLTTHLRREVTTLHRDEQDLFFRVLLDNVYEVALELQKYAAPLPCYLVADMPHGTTETPERALRSASLMIDHGADAVKIEVRSDTDLDTVASLALRGIGVMAHIGYTPQSSKNRRYGESLFEAFELFRWARRIRDSGASSLVLERVTQEVLRALSRPCYNSVLTYGIFSGTSPFGGQSLNAWDSAVKPPFAASFFPPTARIDWTQLPTAYTPNTIQFSFRELLELTLKGSFPKSPRSRLSAADAAKLADTNPWDENDY